MTQTSNRFFDEIARLMNDAAGAASGVKREVETVVRSQAERILRDLDLVKREEFEAVKDMARLPGRRTRHSRPVSTRWRRRPALSPKREAGRRHAYCATPLPNDQCSFATSTRLMNTSSRRMFSCVCRSSAMRL